jgi:Ni/Co efflux regulator RcnB
MKSLILPALGALLLLAAAPAQADPPTGPTGPGAHPTQNHPPQVGPMTGQHVTPGSGPGQHYTPGAGAGQGIYHAPPGGSSTPMIYHRTEHWSGPHDYTPGHRPPNWNVHPRNFDPRVYHHNFTAEHRFHWRSYVRPPGWRYHRWTYGEYLPRAFWVRDYWIDDFWMFGLDIPPYGYEWVQYGDDAILVNVYTGEVLEVVYDVFY